MALLQSRMEKRKKKQRRIRAVEDNDDQPQHRPNKTFNKSKKKQSNFATDLTDTSRAAAKRLRYDANKAQKGNKGPQRGPKGIPKKGKGGPGKPGKGKPGAKTFGKPQAGKQGGRRKK